MRARLRDGMMITGISVAALLMTGCVSVAEQDALLDTNRSLESQNADLRAKVDSQGQQISSLRGQGSTAGSTISELQRENGELRNRLLGAHDSMLDLENRIATLNFVRLDPATDLALSRLAKQHAGLISYDPDRGMLRFSSDLTFRSGSDEVKPEAAASLSALAQVLEAAEAQGYDLQVVGYTDNQKISSSTATRHPTNMHLASHRAIAVRKQLGQQGVEWDRMSVTGWGEYRPIVANNPDGGTAANRRVEIFVVPSTRTALNSSTTTTTATVDIDQERPPAQIDPTK